MRVGGLSNIQKKIPAEQNLLKQHRAKGSVRKIQATIEVLCLTLKTFCTS